jgi:MFS family permease
MANVAVFLLAAQPPRTVFLVGVLPAFLVFWIRRAVPESEEWRTAQDRSIARPGVLDLFRGSVRRTTILTMLVCALALTGHWAFMFWSAQQLHNLPDLSSWTTAQRSQFVSQALTLVMVASITGNFVAAALARLMGNRLTIALMSLAYFGSMFLTYSVPRSHESLFYCLGLIGLSQGVFAPFSMYLPPLFPTLLRTTGAGFCFNIGRLAAAAGVVFFGTFSHVGDYRLALLYAGFLFIPAAVMALFLPESTTTSPPPEKSILV